MPKQVKLIVTAAKGRQYGRFGQLNKGDTLEVSEAEAKALLEKGRGFEIVPDEPPKTAKPEKETESKKDSK